MKNITAERLDEYLQNGSIRYKIALTHQGLKDYKVISDKDPDILQSKIDLQFEKWDAKYTKLLEKEEKLRQLNDLKLKSEQLSIDASKRLLDLENILNNTLEIDDAIDWKDLKSYDQYPITKPVRALATPIDKPDRQDLKYKAEIKLLDKIFVFSKNKKLSKAEQSYKQDLAEFDKNVENQNLENIENEKTFQTALNEWQKNEQIFKEKQSALNSKIDAQKEKYLNGDSEAIEEYCNLVLSNSSYPEEFPQAYEIQYNADNKTIIIDYQLPNLDNIPKIKAVTFVHLGRRLRNHFYLTLFAKSYLIV